VRGRRRLSIAGDHCTVENLLRRSVSRKGPLTLGRYAPSTSPRTRGEVKRAIAFSRRIRARVLQQERKPLMFRLRIKKGRRSAGRRKSNRPHHTNRCRHLSAPRARRAPRTIRLREPPASGALAFRRSTAALARLLPLTQLQAALPGITGCKREDPPRCQCSEHLADRS
jgi:hypothetical protein